MWTTWLFCILSLWSSRVRQKWAGLDPVLLGNPKPYGSVMLFLELLPWGDYSVSSLSVSSWKYLRGTPIGLLFQGVQGIRRPVFIYTGCPRGYSHSCKTHHPSLSMVINCDVVNKDQTFVTYISTPIYHSLVVLISLFPSRDMYHLSRGIKKCARPFPPCPLLASRGDHARTRPFSQRTIWTRVFKLWNNASDMDLPSETGRNIPCRSPGAHFH